MSPKDKWPRGDSLDDHQLDLLLKALEMENLSHHDPPQPLTSIHDGPSSKSPGVPRSTMVPESGLIKGAGKVNFERGIPLVSSRTKPKIADRQNTRMHDPDVQNLASILAEMDEISRKVDMMCANLECLVAGTETGVGDKWRNTPPRLTLESHGLRNRPRNAVAQDQGPRRRALDAQWDTAPPSIAHTSSRPTPKSEPRQINTQIVHTSSPPVESDVRSPFDQLISWAQTTPEIARATFNSTSICSRQSTEREQNVVKMPLGVRGNEKRVGTHGRCGSRSPSASSHEHDHTTQIHTLPSIQHQIPPTMAETSRSLPVHAGTTVF